MKLAFEDEERIKIKTVKSLGLNSSCAFNVGAFDDC